MFPSDGGVLAAFWGNIANILFALIVPQRRNSNVPYRVIARECLYV